MQGRHVNDHFLVRRDADVTAKILGVVMDLKLLYNQHITHAAIKGAKALKRLQMVSSWATGQSFGPTSAGVVSRLLSLCGPIRL